MAFVHLHNHSEYSISMAPPVSRTWWAAPSGLACRQLRDRPRLHVQHSRAGPAHATRLTMARRSTRPGVDKSFLEKGRRTELEEPDPEKDPRAYEQFHKDMATWDAEGSVDSVKPPLVIKPIFGCEVYFTPDDTLARDKKPELYHMVLFARNQTGYVNLMQTVSEAAVDGFCYKPRVTLDNLRRHREGLIASSACIAGIIPKMIDRGDLPRALEWAETFRDLFEPGCFYIEIQEHGITTDSGMTDEQMDRQLIEIAKQIGVKVIATNDFHYLTATTRRCRTS